MRDRHVPVLSSHRFYTAPSLSPRQQNFSDVQFFLGASFCADTMVFSIYPEGALTPNFYFIMGGLKAEKF